MLAMYIMIAARHAAGGTGEAGQAMVEYVLTIALIAIVCILVMNALGVAIGELLDSTQNRVEAAPPPPVSTST